MQLPSPITVRLLDYRQDQEILRELRMRVLYPGLSQAKSFYPGDEEAVHIGAFDPDGTLIGIASLFLRAEGEWQLRGMATLSEWQGTGAGRAVVLFAEAYARSHNISRLWCNARVAALGFYAKCGWTIEGEEFTVPDIGPHFVMVSNLIGG